MSIDIYAKHKINLKSLGDRIRRSRNLLSATKLAIAIGVSEGTIRRWEAGKFPRINEKFITHLERIAEVCRVDPHWLIEGEGLGPAVGVDSGVEADEETIPSEIRWRWEVEPWSVIVLKGLGDRIREARGEMNQVELARRIGVERSALEAMEACKLSLDDETLRLIVAATGCDPIWLASGRMGDESIEDFAQRIHEARGDPTAEMTEATRTIVNSVQASFLYRITDEEKRKVARIEKILGKPITWGFLQELLIMMRGGDAGRLKPGERVTIRKSED